MAKIFHIIPKNEWAKAKKVGVYHPATLESDGFVHCSRADQLLGVANSFFKGRQDLLLLRLKEELIKPEIKHEASKEAPWSDVLYPHIYGELNLDAVEREIEFPCLKDGHFALPDDLLS